MEAVLVRTELGRRIIQLREQRQWTQGDLAREARVGRSWLSLVETGDVKMPGGAKLERLADALGVTPQYLLHGDRGEVDAIARYPAAETGVFARFLSTRPEVRRLLVEMIHPLEQHFELPIKRIDDDGGQQPNDLPEGAAGDEGNDEPEH